MRRWGSISQPLRAAHLAGATLLLAASLQAQLGQQPVAPTTSAGTLQSSRATNAIQPATSPTLAQDPFGGSVVGEKATDQVVAISLKDAINRGLKANLGALLTEQGITNARAQRWRALQSLLPDVTGRV